MNDSELPEQYRGALYRLRRNLASIVRSMRAIPCWLLGHVPAYGPRKRSPYTVYTHLQNVDCSRCGKHLYRQQHYIDARRSGGQA